MSEPHLKRNQRTGLIDLVVPIPGLQRCKRVSTGERNLKRARAVVQEHGADRLIHLARAGAVTAKTIEIVTLGRAFTCKQVFDLWKERMAVTMAAQTAESYGTNIAGLFDGLNAWDRPAAWLTEYHLYQWVNDGVANYQTSMSRLSAARSFFNYAIGKGATLSNPAQIIGVDVAKMSVAQLDKRPVRPITPEEYATLITSPRVNPRWRDWAILSYCTGLRMFDCIRLQWASFSADTIKVFPRKIRGAIRKPLLISLKDPMIGRPELLDLVQRLLAQNKKHHTFVWPVHASQYLTHLRPAFSAEFRTRVLRRCGITGATFHSLRRAFACRLEATGLTIEQIAARMSHGNTATTQIYLDSAKNLPPIPAGADSVHPAGNPVPAALESRSSSANVSAPLSTGELIPDLSMPG